MGFDKIDIQLIKFVLLAFFIAWCFWIPIYFQVLPTSLIPLGFLGPITSATMLTFISSGKKGLAELYSGLTRVKVKPIWFLAIFLPAVLTTLTHFIFSIFFEYNELTDIPTILINYLIISLFLVLEEVGWRGYALPRLLNSRSALKSSLILGLIWALWHFPFWTISPIEGAPEPFYIFYITGTLGAIAMAIILTWIFNNTRKSILFATLCHASFNATIGAITFDKTVAIYHNLIFVVLSIIASISLILVFGAKDLRQN
ncbi:MAG: CPBP family intramembrane metalloprotease [Allomuricauda sp.]|nr:MAG: CPBP family intramembrane metalloprotease [Allomuricauda sp.]